ncbi:hypothetical protein SxD43FB_20505 [Sphingobium sp. D43FB]|nr:hypothetical protein SxD43FB_20505 [Sphingobium sp. D43FB]
MTVKNYLFVCSQNRLRSPTAEQIFASHPGIETLSAGTNNDAETPLARIIRDVVRFGGPRFSVPACM